MSALSYSYNSLYFTFLLLRLHPFFFFFFFNDTATTEIYTLSLHDALPICSALLAAKSEEILILARNMKFLGDDFAGLDRKSTRLNSSHGYISYAVFCLKKKKKKKDHSHLHISQRYKRYTHFVYCVH